jgi:hypothetical protein
MTLLHLLLLRVSSVILGAGPDLSYLSRIWGPPHRHFALKLRGQKVKAGKTRTLPTPRVDPKELLEVEQEYLRRYFRSKQEIQQINTETTPMPVPSEEMEVPHVLSFYQPINRRERLR